MVLRLRERILTAALCLSPLTAWADTTPKTGCDKFWKGTGILMNIVERYYQPTTEDTSLVNRILILAKDDASQALTIEKALLPQLGSSSACSGLKTSLTTLITDIEAYVKALEDAITACKAVTLDAPESAIACKEKAVASYKKSREIGLDEDGARVGPKDGKLIRFMDEHARSSCENVPTSIVIQQDQIHPLLAMEWCARDERCKMTRLGKLREAREWLGKVDAPADAASAAKSWARALHEAEHKIWYLRDHPESDNGKVFEAALQVTQAAHDLRELGSKACPD